MIEKKGKLWESEVRGYEVDFQGIVNNANYFHYLDNARCLYFKEYGVDVPVCSKEGINIVIIEAKISFKSSLRYPDKFTVESILSQLSKIKFLFDQKIYLSTTREIILEAHNTVCAVDSRNGRPFLYEKLLSCIVQE